MDIQTGISPSDSMKNENAANTENTESAEAARNSETAQSAKEAACQELGSRILYACRGEICARFPFFHRELQPFPVK